MSHEKNNFDFLRILFASLVIITHSYALMGLPEIDILSKATSYRSSLSFVGVRGFFSISGFLIFTSFVRTESPIGFLWKRFIRIWPALFILLLITSFIAGPWVTVLKTGAYFKDINTYHYVYNNLLLLKGISYSLPGVFSNNLYPTAVNGSLWTLPYEVLFYLVLFLFYVNKKFPYIYLLIPCWILFFILRVIHYPFSGTLLSPAFDKMLLVELSMYFMAGMILSYYSKLVNANRTRWFVFFASVCLFIAFANHPALYWLQLILIPLATLSFAYLPIPIIHQAGVWGDFSYGIYIYGFLVQQMLVALSNNTIGLYNLMWLALVVTFGIAILSWHLIEKWALQHKDLHRLLGIKK
jgi:peptidoglycan/LPS O-acetylase OafA/YrhL